MWHNGDRRLLLWSAGPQVPVLAGIVGYSGLRIQKCRSWTIGHNCCSDLIPGLRTPYAVGWWEKKNDKESRVYRRYYFRVIASLTGK